jgi:hypothetical protein
MKTMNILFMNRFLSSEGFSFRAIPKSPCGRNVAGAVQQNNAHCRDEKTQVGQAFQPDTERPGRPSGWKA